MDEIIDEIIKLLEENKKIIEMLLYKWENKKC